MNYELIYKGALEHILWIRDCGIDGPDESGVTRNWPTEERDRMYHIAKLALTKDEPLLNDVDTEVFLDAVRKFFYYLDIKEESDSGRVFSPNHIASCRVMDGIALEKVLKIMRDAVIHDEKTK